MEEIIQMQSLKTPVLFLVFNRLDTTKKVFDAIKKAKPPRLYIGSDGPRERKEGEAEEVKAIREYVLSSIDWDCEVKTLFRDSNLGCGKAVSEAITWFFNHEEKGIILEDDCLPAYSFFRFCEELLEKFKDDERIMKIAGYNMFWYKIDFECDYYFSNFGFAWGWASWNRAWKLYDFEMKKWGRIRNSAIIRKQPFFKERNIVFEDTYNKKIDTWDYQWDFAFAINGGLSVIPRVNLIQNIGFRSDATHTKNRDLTRELPYNEISFPLKHNDIILPNHEYEKFAKNSVKMNFFDRFKKLIKN